MVATPARRQRENVAACGNRIRRSNMPTRVNEHRVEKYRSPRWVSPTDNECAGFLITDDRPVVCNCECGAVLGA